MKVETTPENAYEKIVLIQKILGGMYETTDRQNNDYVQGTLDAIWEVIGEVK